MFYRAITYLCHVLASCARRPHGSITAVAMLILVVVWWPQRLPLLLGTDAAVYCEVARQIALRPWAQWALLTLDGDAFFEHPPLMMYALAAAFAAWGPSTKVAICVAQLLTTMLVALTCAVAARVGGRQAAVGTLVGLSLQSGFWHEAQNPMLELPTTVALLAALWGVTAWHGPHVGRPFRLLGATAACLGPAAAVLTKGPVGALWLPVVAVCCMVGVCTWRAALSACAASLFLLLIFWIIFEQQRARLGAEPFLSRYLTQQLWPSMVQGRHNPQASWGYYGPILWRWYAAGVAACGAVFWLGAKSRISNTSWPLAAIGLTWLIFVVVGFSLMRQKYQWYMHTAMPAFGWLTAIVLLALPRRLQNTLNFSITALGVAATLGFLAAHILAPERLEKAAPPCLVGLHSLQMQPEATKIAGPRRLACCLPPSGWRERYVALFLHDAKLVPCGEPAHLTLTENGWLPEAAIPKAHR